MIVLTVVTLILLVGVLVGISYDQYQMQKHVPYESYPSGLPLPLLRRLAFAIWVVGWLPILLIFCVDLLTHTKEERAERRKQLKKQLGIPDEVTKDEP